MTDPKTVTVQERLNAFVTCGCGDEDWPLLRHDTVTLLDRYQEALEIAVLGFEKHARHWQASAERTSLIEDRLRAENAQALADATRAVLTQLNGGRNVG